MTEDELLSLCEALESPPLQAFLRAIGRDGARTVDTQSIWNDEQPSGSTVRRLVAAACEPFADTVIDVQPGFTYWCFLTAEIRRALHRIDLTCSAHSRTAEWLRENPAALVHLRLESAINSSRLDGLEIDYESAKDLLLLSREPRNRPEHSVANSFALFGKYAEYAEYDYSVDLFVDMFENLAVGMALPTGWLDRPLSAALPSTVYPHMTARDALAALSLHANASLANCPTHPVIIGIILERFFSVYEPFPLLNGTMGRFVWHHYVTRMGYPVLGVIPYSSALTNKQREPGQRVIYATAVESREWIPNPNVTELVSARLAIVREALDDLEKRMKNRDAQRDALGVLLAADPQLNPRQRTIIGRALRIPSATFRIPYHQTSHGIAYSTAHADFVELEEKGYLVRERMGHAHIYRAAEDLPEKIGKKALDVIGDESIAEIWGSG